jgi:four helix bundle protein
MLKTHKELLVWQKSFDFCKEMYAATRAFPEDERFGLTAQLRRASVSVPSNIAEGYNRATRPDYVRFLWLANGSVAEIETQLLLSRELGYGRGAALDNLLESLAEIERMLRALIRSLSAPEVKS